MGDIGSEPEAPLLLAHRFARQADESGRKGHFQQAIDKHTRAAHHFRCCLTQTSNTEGHQALVQLVLHNVQAALRIAAHLHLHSANKTRRKTSAVAQAPTAQPKLPPSVTPHIREVQTPSSIHSAPAKETTLPAPSPATPQSPPPPLVRSDSPPSPAPSLIPRGSRLRRSPLTHRQETNFSAEEEVYFPSGLPPSKSAVTLLSTNPLPPAALRELSPALVCGTELSPQPDANQTKDRSQTQSASTRPSSDVTGGFQALVARMDPSELDAHLRDLSACLQDLSGVVHLLHAGFEDQPHSNELREQLTILRENQLVLDQHRDMDDELELLRVSVTGLTEHHAHLLKNYDVVSGQNSDMRQRLTTVQQRFTNKATEFHCVLSRISAENDRALQQQDAQGQTDAHSEGQSQRQVNAQPHAETRHGAFLPEADSLRKLSAIRQISGLDEGQQLEQLQQEQLRQQQTEDELRAKEDEIRTLRQEWNVDQMRSQQVRNDMEETMAYLKKQLNTEKAERAQDQKALARYKHKWSKVKAAKRLHEAAISRASQAKLSKAAPQSPAVPNPRAPAHTKSDSPQS